AGIRPDDTVIVDCLTLWVANLIGRGDAIGGVLELAHRTSSVAARRTGATIVVSNEVGLGVVPATELGRVYRDALGEVNRIGAARAERVWLTVAGKALPLRSAKEIAHDVVTDP